jgi:chemotaxis protein CheD
MDRMDVGIGQWLISDNPNNLIKTYALGSCVALTLWDKKAGVGGLIHMALPESSINPDKAESMPGYFVDTGLKAFFREAKQKGASRENSTIKLIGGSSILDESKTFDIGKRNILATKKHLWKMGLGINREDIGGKISRTVSLNVETGEIVISHAGNTWNL